MPQITPGSKVTDMSAQARQQRSGGFVSRLGESFRYLIAGVTPATFMGPDQPIEPQAQDAAGRLRDYLVGYNLLYVPRGEELTSFEQLRMLADTCDLVRMAIETRKDQLSALQWSISNVDTDKDSQDDPRVQRLSKLLQYPDGHHSWHAWLRMVIEEVLVTDAVAIYPTRTYGGDLLALEIMDGATLKVLTDANGRTPLAPSPAYQQRLKGLPAVDYTAEEVFYMPRNPRASKFYGYSPVEQIQLTINIAIRRTVSQLQYFTAGNIPEAFASLGPDWAPQMIKQFQEYWDSFIEGNQAYKRKIKFMPSGTKIEQTRLAVLQDTFDEWLARIICYAFSLPPTQFVKQATRTTSDVLQEAALDEGLAPLKQWVRDLMNYLIRFYFKMSDLEFVWEVQNPLDPQSEMTVLTNYLKVGAMTLNEVRKKLGFDPLPGGDEPRVYGGTGAVPLIAAPVSEPSPVAEEAAAARHHEPAEKGLMVGLRKDLKTRDHKPLADSLSVALATVGDNVSGAVAKGDGKLTDAGASEIASSADLSGLSLAEPDITDAVIASAKDGAASAGAAAGSDMESDAVRWARQHAAELISSDGNGGELAAATRNMIRTALVEGIAQGQSRAELVQTLKSDYAFSPERAALIAQTEIRNAQGGGLLEAYKRGGMMQKRWLLSNDANVCPLCIANADQGWIPISESFVSGAQHPLQHPRCQCDMAARRQQETS